MTDFIATCRCGQLSAICAGDPVRVSVCHCLECQRRSGSVFATQARWPIEQVTVTGTAREWAHTGESGNHAVFRFCPDCGCTIAFVIDRMPDLVAIPVGAFADPAFPPPAYSVFEERKHRWVALIGDTIEHFD